MSPEQMMSQFKNIRGNDHKIRFGLDEPAITLKVGLSDKVAADLLGWMSDNYPHLTRAETLSTLQSAAWWVIFFGTLADDEMEEQPA